MSSRSRNLGQIVQGIQMAQQNLSTLINRIVDPMGMNISQLTVLAHFSNRPNKIQTITSIAAAVDMNQPSVTKIVGHLTGKGWLSREADSSDARKKQLKITAEGLGIVIRAYKELTPAIGEAFASISDEQARQLQILLNQINGS
jgi:DNA-binding MarR family transcriptional regulator